MSQTLNTNDNPTPLVANGSAVARAASLPSRTVQLALAPREWLPLAAWSIRRTGQKGLVGIALLVAAAIFLLSTHLPLRDEVAGLRQDLAHARAAAEAAQNKVPALNADDPRLFLDALPQRVEVPKILGIILAQADTANLSLDTGKYDVSETRAGSIARYNISFPVSGTYASVRGFIDNVLVALPTVTVSELSIERKNIADPNVEANVRLSLFTQAAQ